MKKRYVCDICGNSLKGTDPHRFNTSWNERIRVCGHCVRIHGGKKEVEEAYEIGNVILIK